MLRCLTRKLVDVNKNIRHALLGSSEDPPTQFVGCASNHCLVGGALVDILPSRWHRSKPASGSPLHRIASELHFAAVGAFAIQIRVS